MIDSNHQAMIRLIKSFSGQANILTIPRAYIELTQSHRAALLLSQCVYWSDKGSDLDGWFFKTYAEWDYELGLNHSAIDTAMKVVSRWVETKVKKVGKTPKTHYRVNFDLLASDLLESSKSDLPKSSKSDLPENSKTPISKTTIPETTDRRAAQDALPLGLDADVQGSKPTPKPKAKRKGNADPRSTHPAIVALHEIMGRYPKKEVYDQLIDVIGDNPDVIDLKKCYEAWTIKGWRPDNYTWVTEWYVSGIPVFGKNGTNGTNGMSEPKSWAALRNVAAQYAREEQEAQAQRQN